MIVTKVISSSYNSVKNLVIKVLGRGAIIEGKGDIREAKQAAPFGIDSRPPEGKIALFQKSEVYGKYYIIGILNTECLTEVGETRVFSTNDDGALKTFIHLKNDGKMLIGGNSFGGLAKVKDASDPMAGLLKKINNIEDQQNSILQALQGITITLAPSGSIPFAPFFTQAPLTPTTEGDISNDKTFHGT